MARRTMTVEEALALAPAVGHVPQEILERAAENLPRYLWIQTEGRERWMRCEACGSTREEHKGRRWPSDLKQGERTACPCCGETVTPKHLDRGFRHIRDRVKLVWYDRSPARPDALVAYGAWCERDFGFADGERPWALPVEAEVRSFAVFIPGEDGYRFRQYRAVWEDERGFLHDGWKFRPVERLGHLTFGDQLRLGLYADPVPAVLLDDTLDDALRGTAFARAWSWEYLMNDRGFDGVEALTLIARYPCIEYMTKLRMTDFLKARLQGQLPPGEVNWNGRSMAEVFRLDRGRLGELKHAGIALTPELLPVLHWLDRAGIRLTAPAAENVAVLLGRHSTAEQIVFALERGLEPFQPSRRKKAIKYMARTAERHGGTRLHAGDFFDYWRDAAGLGDDLNDDAVAFPADLHAAEARLEARLRRQKEEADAAANAERDAKIRERWKQLNRQYGFSFGGLTLRPAMDCAEVRREGQALRHCVGGYASDYAAGRTNIFVLRRDVDPDMPWRTVEISSAGKMVQDRGFHNDIVSFGLPITEDYRAALDCFWSAWRERNKVIA